MSKNHRLSQFENSQLISQALKHSLLASQLPLITYDTSSAAQLASNQSPREQNETNLSACGSFNPTYIADALIGHQYGHHASTCHRNHFPFRFDYQATSDSIKQTTKEVLSLTLSFGPGSRPIGHFDITISNSTTVPHSHTIKLSLDNIFINHHYQKNTFHKLNLIIGVIAFISTMVECIFLAAHPDDRVTFNLMEHLKGDDANKIVQIIFINFDCLLDRLKIQIPEKQQCILPLNAPLK